VGPKAGLDVMAKRKKSLPLPEIEVRSLCKTANGGYFIDVHLYTFL